MPGRERIRSRRRIRTKVLVIIAIGALVTSAFLSAIIIPLYSYPGVDWNEIIASKEANPGVAIVVIINPDNGPGQSQDPNYVTGVNNLRAAGVIVLGYDHTSYAARPLSDVIADINSYKSWYNVSGIFFDEMSNVPRNENYYSTLNNYSKSVGLNLTVGNPGSSVPAGYLGTLDVIVTYESQGVPNSTSLASMTNGLPKNDIAVIAYGVDTFNSSSVSNVLKYANYVYVTNNTLPNPYGAVTGDFSKLVALLASPFQTSVSLTVNSVDAAGGPIVGLWTVISSTNGSVVASGYTPLTDSVHSGDGYVVSVADFGSFVFNHWSGESTNPVMTLTVRQNTTLTAHYGANSSSISTSSSTSSTPSAPITSSSSSNPTTSSISTIPATSTGSTSSTTSTDSSTPTATVTTTAATSTATMTTTLMLTTIVTTIRTTTSTETVTSTIQNRATTALADAQDLTPYLLVGIAIVIAGGLLGLALIRPRKSS